MIRKLPLNFSISLLVAFEHSSLCVCWNVCVFPFVYVCFIFCLCVFYLLFVCLDQPDTDAQVVGLMGHAALGEDFFTPSKCVSTIVR